MFEFIAVSMLSPRVFDICDTCNCFLLLVQRAKIGPGKNTDGKSANAASRFDSNGNQDRMKLADFNFLMVLGKGSFGKVSSRGLSVAFTLSRDGRNSRLMLNGRRAALILNNAHVSTAKWRQAHT